MQIWRLPTSLNMNNRMPNYSGYPRQISPPVPRHSRPYNARINMNSNQLQLPYRPPMYANTYINPLMYQNYPAYYQQQQMLQQRLYQQQCAAAYAQQYACTYAPLASPHHMYTNRSIATANLTGHALLLDPKQENAIPSQASTSTDSPQITSSLPNLKNVPFQSPQQAGMSTTPLLFAHETSIPRSSVSRTSIPRSSVSPIAPLLKGASLSFNRNTSPARSTPNSSVAPKGIDNSDFSDINSDEVDMNSDEFYPESTSSVKKRKKHQKKKKPQNFKSSNYAGKEANACESKSKVGIDIYNSTKRPKTDFHKSSYEQDSPMTDIANFYDRVLPASWVLPDSEDPIKESTIQLNSDLNKGHTALKGMSRVSNKKNMISCSVRNIKSNINKPNDLIESGNFPESPIPSSMWNLDLSNAFSHMIRACENYENVLIAIPFIPEEADTLMLNFLNSWKTLAKLYAEFEYQISGENSLHSLSPLYKHAVRLIKVGGASKVKLAKLPKKLKYFLPPKADEIEILEIDKNVNDDVSNGTLSLNSSTEQMCFDDLHDSIQIDVNEQKAQQCPLSFNSNYKKYIELFKNVIEALVPLDECEKEYKEMPWLFDIESGTYKGKDSHNPLDTKLNTIKRENIYSGPPENGVPSMGGPFNHDSILVPQVNELKKYRDECQIVLTTLKNYFNAVHNRKLDKDKILQYFHVPNERIAAWAAKPKQDPDFIAFMKDYHLKNEEKGWFSTKPKAIDPFSIVTVDPLTTVKIKSEFPESVATSESDIKSNIKVVIKSEYDVDQCQISGQILECKIQLVGNDLSNNDNVPSNNDNVPVEREDDSMNINYLKLKVEAVAKSVKCETFPESCREKPLFSMDENLIKKEEQEPTAETLFAGFQSPMINIDKNVKLTKINNKNSSPNKSSRIMNSSSENINNSNLISKTVSLLDTSRYSVSPNNTMNINSSENISLQPMSNITKTECISSNSNSSSNKRLSSADNCSSDLSDGKSKTDSCAGNKIVENREPENGRDVSDFIDDFFYETPCSLALRDKDNGDDDWDNDSVDLNFECVGDLDSLCDILPVTEITGSKM